MRIVLLGAPGSGKGTQSQLLIQKENATQLSTGDLLRKAVSEGTDLGKKAKGIMEAGKLVPDDLVVGLIREKLESLDDTSKIIFDGFPRNVEQAKALDALLAELNLPLDRAIYIKVPQEELVKRLSGRRSCKDCGAAYHIYYNPPKKEGVCNSCGGTNIIQRSDDVPEVIQERFKTYENQTLPVIDYYGNQGKLVEIDGSGDPDSTFERLVRAVQKSS